MIPKTISCSRCNALNQRYVDDSLVFCIDCGNLIASSPGFAHVTTESMPPDWSFLQLGSIVKVYEETFTLVGRVRLQLRNDYKNFWYGIAYAGARVWVMESFASIGIMNTTWYIYYGEANTLHAGGQIKPNKDFRVKGEFVEKCEAIHFQGEISDWNLFEPGFFFIQAANIDNGLAVFTVKGAEKQYLMGHKISLEILEIEKMITWDEWK
jgi:hypothetical protein